MDRSEELASALAACWDAAELTYLLHSSQEELHEEWMASDLGRFIVVCARRWGKSFLFCVIAIETALRTAGADVKYAAPTKIEAEEIVVPIMSLILDDCPAHLMPVHKISKLTWTFPNGSRIKLAGCDTRKDSDRLRGTSCDLAIVDEAGFVTDLPYLLKSVLFPQFLTTGGSALIGSTPSISPAHPFVATYMREAEEAGTLRVRTVYDSPLILPHMIAQYIKEAGGEESSDWQREGLAKVVVDESRAIVPEFTQEFEDLVIELRPEEHVDRYTIADFGYSDMTVIGFFEWRFQQNKLYQVDELVYRNQGSADIAPGVFAKERELWGAEPPMMRYGDPNAHQSHGLTSRITLRDLAIEHDQEWAAVRRDNLQSGVNVLRLCAREHRFGINPRCTTTIAHMRGGVWNANRTSFMSSGEFGHFDGVAMLMYAIRHADRTRNPHPRHAGKTHDTHFIPETTDLSPTGQSIHDAIRGRK